jgi:phytoene dehydrogenase-like protein/NAD-dependent dihydropyrimidine dehydrogenase PreA subunit
MTIHIDAIRCTGCNYCTISCPNDAISLTIEKKAFPTIQAGSCTECGDCLYICPNNVFSDPERELPNLEIEDHYDIIIVGAGIGGLLTAAGLAKHGKKVLVLEQLSFIGGKYTHLDHEGYAISTAAWTCPGPNSRIGKLSQLLGADVDWVTIHDIESRGDHWVALPDGTRFHSLDEAQETLVGGNRGMAQVYKWISDMYNPGATYPDDMTAREYIELFFPGNEDYIKYVETIITYCFASQTVDNFSAMETKKAIIDSIEQMSVWGTAIGGTAALVKAIGEVVLQNGGKIATCTKVDKILISEGKANGVTLEAGRRIDADIIIHNAGLNRLIQLVGPNNLPDDYTESLKSAIPARVAALILGSKEPLLGKDHSLLHAMDWERTLNCYAPTFFDPQLAPENRHALDVFWVMEPPYNLKDELEIVSNQLRKIFPDFDEQVEIQVPMFFSGMWTAEMAHRIGQSGNERLDSKSPIDNLYLVGYDCNGYGMAGDIIPHGVYQTLHLILKDKKFTPEIQNSALRIQRRMKSFVFNILSFVKSISS